MCSSPGSLLSLQKSVGGEGSAGKKVKKNMTQRASLASCPAGLGINSPKAENPDKTSSSYAIISP